MKMRVRFLWVILLIVLTAVRVTAASAAEPDRELLDQSIVSELPFEPTREASGTVSWPAVAMAGLSGTGAGVITAVTLYKNASNRNRRT